MIDTALKHWIYEVCIDVVFDGIYKNFVPVANIYKIGEKFHRIVTRENYGPDKEIIRVWTFFDAEVVAVIDQGIVVICQYYHVKINETYNFPGLKLDHSDGEWYYYEGDGVGINGEFSKWLANFRLIVDVLK